MSKFKTGPENFRTMSFPTPRDGTTAIYAPLPPSPAPRAITLTEAETRALQLKEMKKFINNERCPSCSGQLEGSVGFDRATVFCCVGGEKEYKAHYKLYQDFPHWSVTTFYTTHFAFEIENTFIVDEMFKNTICKIDLSYNERFQQSTKKQMLQYEGARLIIKTGLTEEQLEKKIKLYTLFS
jgi:hypothetical protein